jgi:hypothetical protein
MVMMAMASNNSTRVKPADLGRHDVMACCSLRGIRPARFGIHPDRPETIAAPDLDGCDDRGQLDEGESARSDALRV